MELKILNEEDLKDPNTETPMRKKESAESLHPAWSQGQEDREMQRVATGFVAALMATAAADYLKIMHEDNHARPTTITAAQVYYLRFSLPFNGPLFEFRPSCRGDQGTFCLRWST